jgi:hypothetical protein
MDCWCATVSLHTQPIRGHGREMAMHIMRLTTSRSCLAALVVAASLCLAVGAQAPSISPVVPLDRSLTVRAADIVNFDGMVTIAKGGGMVVIYTVPPDKYLVVTDVEFDSSGFVDLMASGVVKRSFPFTDPATAFHSSIGLAFPPSSTLALRNAAGGFGSDFCNYSLTGYLANP